MAELNQYYARLRELLPILVEELRNHVVLKDYWDDVSLVLKGSAARGFADQYSDLDFVLFTDDRTYRIIVDEYVRLGLSRRTDGVFLPLSNWDGHYNLDTYSHLADCSASRDACGIWEYSNAEIIHDKAGKCGQIIAEGKQIFDGRINAGIRDEYIELKLQMDWLRQPLRRGDNGAALLYGAAFLRAGCRLCYLLCGQAYPCDKWLFYYLNDLKLPDSLKSKLSGFYIAFTELQTLQPYKELDDYVLYGNAKELSAELVSLLHQRFGDAEWIDSWYLYA